MMRGDLGPLNDEELLFTSGRLDSLDAIEIIMTIEQEYGINFAEIEFDLTLLDLIAAIDDLVGRATMSMACNRAGFIGAILFQRLGI